jgi:hypothetical protein
MAPNPPEPHSQPPPKMGVPVPGPSRPLSRSAFLMAVQQYWGAARADDVVDGSRSIPPAVVAQDKSRVAGDEPAVTAVKVAAVGLGQESGCGACGTAAAGCGCRGGCGRPRGRGRGCSSFSRDRRR